MIELGKYNIFVMKLEHETKSLRAVFFSAEPELRSCIGSLGLSLREPLRALGYFQLLFETPSMTPSDRFQVSWPHGNWFSSYEIKPVMRSPQELKLLPFALLLATKLPA